MTQSTDITLADQSGASYRSEHNSINQAFGSTHKGSSQPSYVLTGMQWIDDTATPWVWNIYDGADDLEVGRINASTNKISFQANLIDSNGNEVLEHTATASAVNHINITNAATGNGATIQTVGGDTNIDLTITTKGTGTLKFDKEVAFPDKGELTISSGAITVTGVNHTIDTESDAASDDLDTINGGVDGQILIVRAENAARTVVIKDGTGNIETPTGEDITLDEVEKTVMLKYDGATSDWHVIASPAVAGGGAWTFISSQTASNDASIDFTSGIDGTYPLYAIQVINCNPVSSASLEVRTDGNGGASFDAGASDYFETIMFATSSGVSSSGGTSSSIQISDTGVGTGAQDAINGIIYIYNPSASTNTQIMALMGAADGTSAVISHTFGARNSAAAVDAIRLLMSSGNIASGTFVLYGIKNS